MEDILSQEEIDLLIQSSQEPQGSDNKQTSDQPKDNSRYDFRRPNKFSKEHMRALQRIHEQFSRTYSGLMSAKLRTKLDLNVNSIEQLTFGEFARSLPNPTVVAVLDSQPLEGNIIVQLTPDIAFVLHDRLCGGSGNSSNKSRALSDIELAILHRQVITLFCELLNDAWKEVGNFTFKPNHIESNPQFLQITADSDVVVLLTLSFEVNEIQDMLNICIPYRTIEPIINKLTQHRLFDSLKQPTPHKLKELRQKVKSSKLSLEVELGQTSISVQDILDLEVGDVIPLEKGRNENLDVKVGSLTKFKATPGKIGDRLGVVITSVCEPEEGDNDDE